MRRDIIEGKYEFHRDDDGTVIFVEREPGDRPGAQMVIIPSELWQRVWPQLVSLAEMRKLSGGRLP